MRSVELFAGCGGLALGLSRAGFRPSLVIENDPQIVQTLQENHAKGRAHVAHWPIWDDDVRDIDFEGLKRIALVSGGPPCQPFSIGGKHLGPKDSRNMWPEAIRVVREVQPKAFLFENVRGLLRPAFASYVGYLKKQLAFPHIAIRKDEKWRDHFKRLRQHAKSTRAEPAYRVIARAINTADYGAPQKRYRAIVLGVATRYGDEWDFPEPTHTQAALVWDKHISRNYWERHGVRRVGSPSSSTESQILEQLRESDQKPKGRAWRTVRDAFLGLPIARRQECDVQGHWQHPGAKTYANHTGSGWDEPAKAIKAGDHGVPGGENMICNRNGTPRYFTVREMARLQCLPDSYLISGSWKAATKQLGNAVPAIVGQHFGKRIVEIIG